MEQFRVYDRQTLSYVDGGVIKGYKIDTDYMTNNASEVTLTEETYAKKGDVIVGLSGINKIFIDTITAVDNTKKSISFKQMNEIFADTVINIFKYTGTVGYKFELVGTMELVLT